MTIKVLGSGCPTCKKLFEITKQAVSELKIDSEVEYVNDIEEMLALGAMSSPVLAINGRIALSGQLPNIEKIKEILTNSNKETAEESCDCSCCCC